MREIFHKVILVLARHEGNMAISTAKAALTIVLFSMASVQVASQSVVRGWIHLPISKRSLVRLHDWDGILTVVMLAILIGIGLVDMIFLQGKINSVRLQIHVVLGALAAVALVAKLAITNRYRHYMRLNAWLGIAAALLIIGNLFIAAFYHLFIG